MSRLSRISSLVFERIFQSCLSIILSFRVRVRVDENFDEKFANKYKEKVEIVLNSIKTNFEQKLVDELNEIEKQIQNYQNDHHIIIPIKSKSARKNIAI